MICKGRKCERMRDLDERIYLPVELLRSRSFQKEIHLLETHQDIYSLVLLKV